MTILQVFSVDLPVERGDGEVTGLLNVDRASDSYNLPTLSGLGFSQSWHVRTLMAPKVHCILTISQTLLL